MNERFETDEIPDESPSAGVSAASDSLSVDHLLNHLFQFSDLTYKFVMVCKDSVFQPHDYGTGELVTSIEAHVTSYIDEHPGCSPSELAAYWSRTNGFISQTLKKLEKKELITRERSPKNAKHVLLYTTERGKQFSFTHKQYDALNVSIFIQNLLKTCSKEEVDAFYKVMDAYTTVMLKVQEQERQNQLSK